MQAGMAKEGIKRDFFHLSTMGEKREALIQAHTAALSQPQASPSSFPLGGRSLWACLLWADPGHSSLVGLRAGGQGRKRHKA